MFHLNILYDGKHVSHTFRIKAGLKGMPEINDLRKVLSESNNHFCNLIAQKPICRVEYQDTISMESMGLNGDVALIGYTLI